jgi:protein translocase SecG subunit
VPTALMIIQITISIALILTVILQHRKSSKASGILWREERQGSIFNETYYCYSGAFYVIFAFA